MFLLLIKYLKNLNFLKNYKLLRFQGKPVKIVPLINSIKPKKTEKPKKALKIFFGLNK